MRGSNKVTQGDKCSEIKCKKKEEKKTNIERDAVSKEGGKDEAKE